MELSKKEIQARRVELLEFMRALPPEKVQMSVFQGFWNPEDERIPAKLHTASEWDALDEHDCNTVACILGWTRYKFAERDPLHMTEDGLYEYSALGLNVEEGDELSQPLGYNCYPEFYTRDKVIEILERWVATGIVDWQRPREME